mgnify:CR=1 FL=1
MEICWRVLSRSAQVSFSRYREKEDDGPEERGTNPIEQNSFEITAWQFYSDFANVRFGSEADALGQFLNVQIWALNNGSSQDAGPVDLREKHACFFAKNHVR